MPDPLAQEATDAAHRRGGSRRWLIIAIAVLVTIGVGIPIGLRMAHSSVEAWLKEELSTLAANTLTPKLTFRSLRYEFPATVVLDSPALTAEGRRFAWASSMHVTLAEVPRIGEPVRFSNVRFQNPSVSILLTPEGSVVGFSDFIKDGGQENTTVTSVSDVLAIRSLAFINASIFWRPDTDDSMWLDGLSLEMDGSFHADDAGQYDFSASCHRPDLLSLSTTGKFDVDHGVLVLGSSVMSIGITSETMHQLPPPLQRLIDDHDVAGRVQLAGQGTVVLGDVGASTAEIELSMSDIAAMVGEISVATGMVRGAFRYADHVVMCDMLRLTDVLGGSMSASGTADTTSEGECHLSVAVDDLDLGKMMVKFGSTSPRGGIVSLSVELHASTEDPAATVEGNGTVELKDGRNLEPTFSDDLRHAVDRDAAPDAAPLESLAQSGSGTFSVHPDRLTFSTFRIMMPAVAARGRGDFFYDGTIDFRLNAGPLERLQAVTGLIGEALGMITDRIVTYQVTGTLDEPKLRVRPLGL